MNLQILAQKHLAVLSFYLYFIFIDKNIIYVFVFLLN
jgi:hypothetical protein